MKYNTYNEVDNSEIDHTIDGECSGCGQCCQAILPLSEKEIQKIKSYIGKNNIKPVNRHTVMDTEFKNICPFLSLETGKCLIYSIRPEVCSRFICSDYKKPTAKHFNHMDKTIVNLYQVFYDVLGPYPCPTTDILKLNKNYEAQKSKVIHNYFKKK